MQDNNINEIMSNALTVNKDTLSKNIKDIINQIKNVIEANKDNIENASSIDKNNDNGFILNFDIVNNIFSNIEKENTLYGDVTLSQTDDYKNNRNM